MKPLIKLILILPLTIIVSSNLFSQNWEDITSSPDISISNITFIPNTETTLIGTSSVYNPFNNRVSVYSNDFGENWEIINKNIHFGGTQFIAPNIGWSSSGMMFSSNEAAMYKWEGDIFLDKVEVNYDEDCKIYPNPVTDNIVVSNPNENINEYRLFSTDGKLLKSGIINSQSILNFESLSLGMYHLMLIFDDGTKVSKKIIKAH